jgi:hypothetical protein
MGKELPPFPPCAFANTYVLSICPYPLSWWQYGGHEDESIGLSISRLQAFSALFARGKPPKGGIYVKKREILPPIPSMG